MYQCNAFPASNKLKVEQPELERYASGLALVECKGIESAFVLTDNAPHTRATTELRRCISVGERMQIYSLFPILRTSRVTNSTVLGLQAWLSLLLLP
jgi:hypothetical protein